MTSISCYPFRCIIIASPIHKPSIGELTCSQYFYYLIYFLCHSLLLVFVHLCQLINIEQWERLRNNLLSASMRIRKQEIDVLIEVDIGQSREFQFSPIVRSHLIHRNRELSRTIGIYHLSIAQNNWRIGVANTNIDCFSCSLSTASCFYAYLLSSYFSASF